MIADFDFLETELAKRLESLPAFTERFRAVDHRTISEGVLTEVAAWRWTTRPMPALDPIEQAHRPKRERSVPKLFTSMSMNTGDEYGFDASGRQIVERSYTYFPDHFYVEYWQHGDSWTDGARFDNSLEKRPINVARLYLTDGRPLAFVRFAIKGWKVGVYSDEKMPQKYLEAWQTYEPPLNKWGVTIRACELGYAGDSLDSVSEVSVHFGDRLKSVAARALGG